MDLALPIDLIVKAAVVGLSLYPLARPGSSRFAGKATSVRALLYPATTLLIPATWWLAARPEPYPYLADISLALPFIVDSGSNALDLFAIKGFDAFPHASGWFFLSTAFGLAVAPLVSERWIAFGLVTGFGAIVDILWEIGEFMLMKSGASGLQLTYENTIQDLVMSLAGAAFAGITVATVLWPPAGTPMTLFGWS